MAQPSRPSRGSSRVTSTPHSRHSDGSWLPPAWRCGPASTRQAIAISCSRRSTRCAPRKSGRVSPLATGATSRGSSKVVAEPVSTDRPTPRGRGSAARCRADHRCAQRPRRRRRGDRGVRRPGVRRAGPATLGVNFTPWTRPANLRRLADALRGLDDLTPPSGRRPSSSVMHKPVLPTCPTSSGRSKCGGPAEGSQGAPSPGAVCTAEGYPPR